MTWPVVIRGLFLSFVVGTLVLWVCSFTVKTKKATFKTAAIYNAIMTFIGGILMVILLVFERTESSHGVEILFVLSVLTLIVSFFLLMRLYKITFLAALWLFVIMFIVDVVMEKLIGIVT